VRTVCRLYGNNRIATENGVFGIENRVFVDNRDKSLPQEVYSRVVTELKKSGKSDDNLIHLNTQQRVDFYLMSEALNLYFCLPIKQKRCA
jgi:tripartite-type tricarboxylate transporter receptor subunit TctC